MDIGINHVSVHVTFTRSVEQLWTC